MIDTYTRQQFESRLKLRGILTTKKERTEYLKQNGKEYYTEMDFEDAYRWKEYTRYRRKPTRNRSNTRTVDGQNMASMSNEGNY